MTLRLAKAYPRAFTASTLASARLQLVDALQDVKDLPRNDRHFAANCSALGRIAHAIKLIDQATAQLEDSDHA